MCIHNGFQLIGRKLKLPLRLLECCSQGANIGQTASVGEV